MCLIEARTFVVPRRLTWQRQSAVCDRPFKGTVTHKNQIHSKRCQRNQINIVLYWQVVTLLLAFLSDSASGVRSFVS